jgi:branched-chain amino acid aminotransferase
MFAFINDREVNEAEASISIFDRGFLYGDGVFETLRVYQGRIFRLDAHLRRLFENLQRLKIQSPLSAEQIGRNMTRLLADNSVGNGFVRLIATRGTSEFGLGTKTARDPLVVIYAHNYPPPTTERYQKGISVIISTVRANSQSVMEITKTISRVHHVLAKMEAEEAGADDAVMLNTDGYIAEGTASNLFVVKGGALTTPPVSDGLLPGITRATIFEVCDTLEIPYREHQLKPEDLAEADEAFLSSTMVELMPIVTVNEWALGSGKPGRITQKIHAGFKDLVRRELALPAA